MAGVDTYRSGLRSAARALWSGVVDDGEFANMMQSTVSRGLTAAFNEGAQDCGIKPDEQSAEEQAALARAIGEELSHVDSLATFIGEHSKEQEGKFSDLDFRIDLWLSRYRDLRNLAKSMACQDQKLRWRLNPLKENCGSCIALNGKVKRASFWRKHDVRPQHPTKLVCMLSARGPAVCGCEFEETDEPVSPGPLPGLP